MRRDLNALRSADLDLLVIGGGIHGACVAWDATLRGLRVGLIEQADFGAAASASSLRIVHGGLRYLARADFSRMRESVSERSALLRIAPHLVRPLGVLISTRGSGTEGVVAMRTALVLNDALTFRRNRGLDAQHRLPRGRLVSRAELRRLCPALDQAKATGGALWYDAQMLHPEQLTFAFLRAAADRGAQLANYVRADGLMAEGGAVSGVNASDLETGDRLNIRARCVLSATGASTGALGQGTRPQAFAMNLVLGRRLADLAVGARALSTREEDPIIGGGRYLFAVPHEQTTLLGTWYSPETGERVEALVERGTRTLLEEFNAACPAVRLSAGDVIRAHWGFLPLKGGLERGRADALADRPRIFHDADRGGARNHVTVEGVKYTTARLIAEQAVDLVFSVLGRRAVPCRTAVTVLPDSVGGTKEIHSQVSLAVREEMALHLTDVVFRRTSLGEPPGPSRGVVEAAADAAASELGWNDAVREAELEAVMREAGNFTLEPAR